MPKPPTYPTLYNDVLKFKLKNIKRDGYFAPNIYKSGVTTWKNNFNDEIGSISFIVNTVASMPYFEFDYSYNGEPRNYKVYLTSTPSNLNKGEVWYFICPVTQKKCRVLYSVDGYFLHREAFKGCMYESQTQSKKYRQLDKTLGALFKSDDLYSELYEKNFKKYYNGKPTKKYLRLIEQIQEAESIPYHEIERAMLN